MSRIAIHTEIFNNDGSLAGHITFIKDPDAEDHKYTVRSMIPEEDLDITQTFPYDSYASSRYATMVQKVKAIARRNDVKTK